MYRKRVVIKYVGAPVCPVPASHGNSLSNKPYVRTNPSLLAKIKEIASATHGHAAPAKLYKEAVLGAPSDDVRACPRDMKQVCVYDVCRFTILLLQLLLVQLYGPLSGTTWVTWYSQQNSNSQ